VDGVSSSCTVDLHLGRYSKRFNRTQVGAPQPQPAPRAPCPGLGLGPVSTLAEMQMQMQMLIPS
jgi:hypothetical protein